MKKAGFSFASFCVAICCVITLCAAPAYASFLNKHFTYYAEQEALPQVLAAFARSNQLTPDFTAGVQGTVSGLFESIPGKQFLAAMQSAFGVRYYTQGNFIYFYTDAEVTRVLLTPGSGVAGELQKMLVSTSVAAPELPVTIMEGTGMMVVEGPRAYVEQVQSSVLAFEQSRASDFQMRVFPLRYAWAQDITVDSLGTTTVIPGVASLLSAIAAGQSMGGTTVTKLPAAQQSLGGQGLAAQTSAPAPKANPNPASIIADPRVNAVIITDSAYRMAYYEEVIADLDKPVELVEIHAAIVDIDSNFQRDLGVNLQAKFGGKWQQGVDSSVKPGDFNPLPLPGVAQGGGLGLSTVYTNGADFFIAKVEALEEQGDARVLGRPSVLTMDNIQATLENITSFYVPVSGTTGDTSLADLFKVDSGTVLRVTPHIIPREHASAGELRDRIKLVVSVQDDQSDNAGGPVVGALPPIKQTKINTQAIVDEGQSLLIGGYFYERQGSTDTGIPVLMDIPVLGHLFKTQAKESKRMERLILITPRVVRLDNLPKIPQRVDDPRMHRAAQANDYSERVPQQPPVGSGGCTRRAAQPVSPQPMTQPQSVTSSAGQAGQ